MLVISWRTRLLMWSGLAVGLIIASRFFTRLMNSTNIELKSLGKWAVITGATEAIGRAFTHRLADLEFNIVLIGQSNESLREAAASIERKYSVFTRVISVDFENYNDLDYEIIKDELRLLEIGLVVNISVAEYPHPEYFATLEKNHQLVFQQMVCGIIWPTVNITRCVLPGMLERGRGLIINVSSLLSEFPAPLSSMYAASKAFVTKFSLDLNLEYRDKGIHIHVLNAGHVATETESYLGEQSAELPPTVSPDDYVKSALGMVTKKGVSTGYIWHATSSLLATITNAWVLDQIVLSVMRWKRRKARERCVTCRALSDD